MSRDVLAMVAMGADVERVVPGENSHAMYCRTFGEPSGKHHGCMPNILRGIGDY